MFHITTAPDHPRSNGQAERRVDTLKRALKKPDGNESVDDIQQFLWIYRLTLNPSTNSGLSQAELMLGRKIRSMFDKLLPKQKKKTKKKKQTDAKFYMTKENIFFREYSNGKEIWKAGVVDKRIGRLMYIIKDLKKTIKRHHNQIMKRYTRWI